MSENKNPFNIPQAYFDFVANGEELPEDNGYYDGPINKMELKEKVYKHTIYEWDETNGSQTSKRLGYYLVRYIDIIEDNFECVVWLIDLNCFGSIDGEHDAVWVQEDYETWEEIVEEFELACNPEWERFEFYDHTVPLHPFKED